MQYSSTQRWGGSAVDTAAVHVCGDRGSSRPRGAVRVTVEEVVVVVEACFGGGGEGGRSATAVAAVQFLLDMYGRVHSLPRRVHCNKQTKISDCFANNVPTTETMRGSNSKTSQKSKKKSK